MHNLEHGGIAIWYGPDISIADREALDRFYDEDKNGIIISPIPDPYPRVIYPEHEPLGSKIALTIVDGRTRTRVTARVYIATCPSFDQEPSLPSATRSGAKGPERVPDQPDGAGRQLAATESWRTWRFAAATDTAGAAHRPFSENASPARKS